MTVRAFALSLLATLFLTGCGPLVMFPGGELSGEVKPPPDDWSFTDDVDNVQLETRPEDPYSVNVWAVAAKDAIYIASGRGADAGWARHIAEDPRVRLRVGEAIYELKAEQTMDEAELDAFLAAAQKKYDFEPEPEQREEAVLFRLTPR
jgi:hypothetical protein